MERKTVLVYNRDTVSSAGDWGQQNNHIYVCVAQQDRVTASEAGGRVFELPRGRYSGIAVKVCKTAIPDFLNDTERQNVLLGEVMSDR